MIDNSAPLFPFALIPAAGESRRMGTPKLLLDVRGQTVIARLLAALERGGVGNRFVVINPLDTALRTEVERCGGQALVPPAPPPDMRASVEFGLRSIGSLLAGKPDAVNADCPWLLIPADHPAVLAETVRTLLEVAKRHPGRIIVPVHDGRRGHPTVFRWKHALGIDAIPPDEGFNWIVKRHAAEVVEIPVPTQDVLIDLDTPEDYERFCAS
jgi:molybdenum cofactor cytidylyltransferase